jgi:WXG100 family type VII secretion target
LLGYADRVRGASLVAETIREATMTITIDHESFTARTHTIGSRADAMAERRREIERDVERLLASWRGGAADRFAEAWQQWRDAADGMIASLIARTESLCATLDDLGDTDGSAGDSAARLRGRLG